MSKVTEQQIRRLAHRKGYRLMKFRGRDPEQMSFGRYRIVDSELNAVVAGEPFGFNEEQVNDWLVTLVRVFNNPDGDPGDVRFDSTGIPILEPRIAHPVGNGWSAGWLLSFESGDDYFFGHKDMTEEEAVYASRSFIKKKLAG